jgi:hypothetical protein
MPTIPRYQSQVTPVPSMGRVPIGTYPAFSALESAGLKLEQAAAALKTRQDTADVLNAFVDWQDKTRGQAETLMAARKGKDARGIARDYGSWYDDELSKYYTDRFENDDQRLQFGRLVASHRSGQLTALVKYSLAEDEAYTQQTVRRNAEQLLEQVGRNPDQYAVAIAKFEARTDGLYSPTSGMTDTVKEEFKRNAIIRAVMSGMEKNPQFALDVLDTHKEELPAATYEKLERQASEEQAYQGAMQSAETWDERLAWLADQKSMDPAVKKAVSVKLRNEKSLAQEQIDLQIDALETEFFKLWQAGRLTEKTVDASSLPTAKKVYWTNLATTKARAQDAERRQALKDQSSTTYGLWSQKVTLEPEKYRPGDIFADLGPTTGGLTGEQATRLVDRLILNQAGGKKGKLDQKAVTQMEKDARGKVKVAYNAGEFGSLATPAEKKAAQAVYGKTVQALEDWMDDNKGKDPTEWLDSYLDRLAAEKMVAELDDPFAWVPFHQTENEKRQALTDEELARELLLEQPGAKEDLIKDEHIQRVMGTIEFNRYKTRRLGAVPRPKAYKVSP